MDEFIPLNFMKVFLVRVNSNFNSVTRFSGTFILPLLLQIFGQSLGVIVIVAVINPWLLIPVVLLTAPAQPLRAIYAQTSRSVQRIAAVCMSGHSSQ